MKKKGRKDKLKHKSKLRKQQQSILGSKENITELEVGISDETIYRMEKELSEQYGAEHKVFKGLSDEKMSEVLLEYGKPFIEIINTENKEDYEKSIKISMMLWNCAIMYDSGDKKDRKKIMKMLKPVLPDGESEGVFSYMAERKREMFPDNKRIILNYEITETSGGFHLTVASTIAQEKSEEIMRNLPKKT
jgi:hypothetical protein